MPDNSLSLNLGGMKLITMGGFIANHCLLDMYRKSIYMSETYICLTFSLCNAGNYNDAVVQMEVLPPPLAHRSESVWRNRMSSSGERPETKKSNKKTVSTTTTPATATTTPATIKTSSQAATTKTRKALSNSKLWEG